MYVFDERIAVDIHVDPVVVGVDWSDGTPCERYVNCGNPFCNRRILLQRKMKTNTSAAAHMNAVFTYVTVMSLKWFEPGRSYRTSCGNW